MNFKISPLVPPKIWKQVLLRKTKEKLYPKVLDNYRGSRDIVFIIDIQRNIQNKALELFGSSLLIEDILKGIQLIDKFN